MAPSNITVQRIDKPSEAMVEEAVKIFSDLMPEDPLAVALTGGNPTIISIMVRAMIKPLALVSGEMYTATDQSGVMVAFTLCTRPGRNLFDTEDQLELGYQDLMKVLSEEGKAYHSQALKKDFPAFIDESIGITNTELNGYWCNFAFVRKDYQGKGIAKALFKLAFDKANGETFGLATTNPINVQIYEKIGLELKGYKLMKSPWIDWPVWIFAKKVEIVS
ncbi:hypothetical protein BKA93DRAFT_813721 [Sparassis latifolia]